MRLLPKTLDWLRHEYRTTNTEAALVATRSHYRAFTGHNLVSCGGCGFVRPDQYLFAHPYLDVLVPSGT